jgi:hypothetical protein
VKCGRCVAIKEEMLSRQGRFIRGKNAKNTISLA